MGDIKNEALLAEIAAFIEVEVDDVFLWGSSFLELLGDGRHEARFSASAYSRDDLYQVVIVERSDLLQILLSRNSFMAKNLLATLYVRRCYLAFKTPIFDNL